MMAAFALLGLALFGLQPGGPDSVAALGRAREAQARFERARRASLPFTAPAGGRVEERVGRFRFWHDDGHSTPPPEPAAIREARGRLLAELDSAAARAAGDPWIAGQRVRYLIEQGAPDSAVSAAARCAASPWWCHALLGLARHAAGDVGRAEQAFDAALDAMPADRRCRWTDASLILEGPFRERYRRTDCARRAQLDAHLWWLARPLFLLPGNDRRTEHLARITMSEIQSDARNAYGISWGWDMAEIMVRYGWPIAWGAESRPYGGTEERAVVGYDRTPGFRFVPAPRALAEPYAATEDDWALRSSAPRAQYAPAYADSFVALPHQISTFRRGDSTLVLAAYDLTRDRGFGGHATEVALVLAPAPGIAPVVSRSDRASGVLVATTGPGPLLVGLEALSRGARRAARVRYALPPASATRVMVSDLLLLEHVDSLPEALDRALSQALPSTDLGARRHIVVFWEAYGANPSGEAIEIALSVRRLGEGPLRRATRALGLTGPSRAIRLAWRESPRLDGAAGRAMLLDLSSLGPGRYRIELEVDAEEQDPLIVARDVRLGRAPARTPAHPPRAGTN